MSWELQRTFDFTAAERQHEASSPQIKTRGEESPAGDSVQQVAEELRPRLLSYLAQAAGSVELRDLRSVLGHPGQYMDRDPQSNPVNRLVKEMRDAGELVVQECDRGQPLISLPATPVATPLPPAGQLFGPHDHWTDEERREHEAIRQEYEDAEIPLPADFDTDPEPPYTGYEKTEDGLDAVDIKGNEAAKRAILIAAASSQPVRIEGPVEYVSSFRTLASSFGIRVVDDDDFHGFTVPVLEPSRRELETALPGTSSSQLRDMLDGMADEPPSDFDRNAAILLEAAAKEFGLGEEMRHAIQSLAATIAAIDQVAAVSSGHVAESINYLVRRPPDPSSTVEDTHAESPPPVRPDRQITYDGKPHYDWPDCKELEDRDAITVDRITADIDGPTHRFVIRRGDTVEAYFNREKVEPGEVVGISHTKQEVSVRFAGAKQGIWFYKGRIYPTVDQPIEEGSPDRVPTQPAPEATSAVPVHEPQSEGGDSLPQQRPYQLSDFREIVGKLEDGMLTLAELKGEFARLTATREAFIGSLRKDRTADRLKILANRFGCFDARRNTKQKNAEHIYRTVLQWFTLSETVRFNPMAETIEEVVTAIVEQMTEETFQHELQKRQQERADRDQAMSDPQTLEQFRIYLREHDYREMALEQQDRFDRLMADQTRQRRREIRRKNKVSQIESDEAEGLELKIIEGFHTKQQIPLWICQLSTQVNGDTFKELKRKATMLDGWYSSFVRSQTGFQFKTEEAAKKFQSLLAGDVDRQEILEGRRSRKMESASERLTAVAETLQQNADLVLEADSFKVENTVRRAEMAAGMRGQAYADAAMAGTLKRIAESLSGDHATYLDGLRAKTHVETLIGLLRRAKTARSAELMKEHASKGMWERHAAREELDNRPLREEDIPFAKYPYPSINKRNLEDAVATGKNRKGVKQLSRRMENHLVCTEHFVQFVDDHDVNFLQQFVAACKGAGIETRWIESGMEDHQRLHAANIHTPPELRCALRELLPHLTMKQDDDPITRLEEELIGTKIPGFFPTPRPVVSRMLELVDIQPGERVLEPSAGKGDILDMLREQHPDTHRNALEMHASLIEIIEAKGHDVERSNFLHYSGEHDVVIMNPPFENAAEIDHVRHAFDQLAAGGRLVSVMSAGPFFRSDKKAVAFREWLDEFDHDVEDLPDDAFKGIEAFRETGVRTKLLTISKPAS